MLLAFPFSLSSQSFCAHTKTLCQILQTRTNKFAATSTKHLQQSPTIHHQKLPQPQPQSQVRKSESIVKMSQASVSQFRLIDLPKRLRLKIYAEYVKSHNEEKSRSRIFMPTCPLLLVSKQVREESSPVLMRTLTLHLDGWLQHPKHSWSVDFRPATPEPWTHKTYHPGLLQKDPRDTHLRNEWKIFSDSNLAKNQLHHITSLNLHVGFSRSHAGLEFHVDFQADGPPKILTFTEVRANFNKTIRQDVQSRLVSWQNGSKTVCCSVDWIEAFAEDMKNMRADIQSRYKSPFVQDYPRATRGAPHHHGGRTVGNCF